MEVILTNHNSVTQDVGKFLAHCRGQLLMGKKLVVKVMDYEESLTAQQRRFYHGYILMEIAEQARPMGVKYPMKVWKSYFREKYLGDKIESIVNPLDGTVKREVVRVSSESLGVKGYNRLIEQVTAYACTELNVNFNESFESWTEENMK